MSTAIDIRDVVKRYGPVTALHGVTLSIADNEFFTLLGPSGCGKTTLLRLIAGFEEITTGEIRLFGQDIARLEPNQRPVNTVFQNYALFPHLSVIENVAFGLKMKGVDLPTRRARAGKMLEMVHLSAFADRMPSQLSGGQQQRVALARALAPRPTLILLDEPFSNLDVQVRLHLRQEVRDVLKQVNASGVFVTHDQEEALAIADQVAVMRQGQLEQWGSPESVYSAPVSRFIASFVTQANFIPARRTPQGWETELGLVPQVLQADGATPDATLTQGDIMVRQEDLVLQSVDRGLLRVKSRQFLGREYKYGLSTPSGYTLYVRQPASQAIAVGEQVNPVLPHHPLRIYPPQS